LLIANLESFSFGLAVVTHCYEAGISSNDLKEPSHETYLSSLYLSPITSENCLLF